MAAQTRRTLFLTIGLVLITTVLWSQRQINFDTSKIYRVNTWWSIGIGVAGTLTDYIGVQRLLDKDPITEAELIQLNRTDVPRFDRSALDFKIDNYERNIKQSDFLYIGTFFAPGLLFLDKKISKHWFDIFLMYYEAQIIGSNLYSWTPLGPQWIDRLRPIAFYDELDMSARISGNNRNSFFSGHTSLTATATFFMAKVYHDYHPNLKRKRWLSYSIASLPVALTGFMRVKGLKHFPSDAVIGACIGAAVGVLIPELHRKRQWNIMARFDERFQGIGFRLKL